MVVGLQLSLKSGKSNSAFISHSSLLDISLSSSVKNLKFTLHSSFSLSHKYVQVLVSSI
ncbi:MAG: hypothetical protein Q9M97_08435 [Candidatus Gracilibacteria bacterium]|nr:hypothetical protein [Candidatus Gracilibacteria bacterium]